MATVTRVISGLGLKKFQADGFLLTRVYKAEDWEWPVSSLDNLRQQDATDGYVSDRDDADSGKNACVTVTWTL